MGNDVGLGTIRAAVEVDSRTGEASLTSVADKFKKVGDAAEQSSAKVDRAEKLQSAAISRQLAKMERWVLSVDKNAAAQKRMADAERLVTAVQSQESVSSENLARALAVQTAAAENLARAQGLVNETTSHSVPQFAAASGAIRLLEGGIQNNVRAAERFVATTLGLGPVLMAAFPVVGAIALGAVVVRMAGEFADFAAEAQDLGQRLGEGWLGGAIDQLAGGGKQVKAADDEIQQLNHDLDDLHAKLSADFLGSVKQTEGPAVVGAIEAQQFQSRIAGNNAMIAALEQRLALENAVAQSGGARLYAPNDPRIKADADLRRRASEAGVSQDAGAAGIEAEATRKQILSLQELSAHLRQQASEAVRKGVSDQTAQQQKSAEAAAKAAHSAEHSLLQQWERDFKARQAQQLMTLKDELEFWNERAAAVKKGSADYLAAVDKANDVRIAGARQAHEKLQQIIREAAHPAGGGSDARRGPAGFMMGFGGTEGLFQSGNEALQAAQAKNSEAAAAIARSWVEAADKVAIFEGTTTPLAVALHQQAAHAEEYRLQLKALKDQLAQLQQQDALAAALGGDPALAAKEQQVRTQIAQLQAKAAQAGLQDASVVRAQTVAGATIDALNRMDQAFMNTADMVSGILVQSIGNFNDTLVKIMSEPSWQRTHSWDQLGASFFTSVSKAALQQGEGRAIGWAGQHVPFLKHLGLGGAKVDGSTGAPFHVIVDNGAVGSGLGALFGGGTSSHSGGSSANGFMSFVAGLFGGGGGSGISGETADSTAYDSSVDGITIPGFANGGPIPSNMPAIVGERGPELFMPSTPGHIVPNHQLRGMGGISVHIDARGSTDPATVEASVHRAMISYLPAMQSMAVASVRDNRRRSANPWSA